MLIMKTSPGPVFIVLRKINQPCALKEYWTELNTGVGKKPRLRATKNVTYYYAKFYDVFERAINERKVFNRKFG